jgi:hypothetical protein
MPNLNSLFSENKLNINESNSKTKTKTINHKLRYIEDFQSAEGKN